MKIDIPNFNESKVLVLGDVMLDRYWHGNTSRISPEAPVPVVHVADAEERAGGAGNVAINIASLGAHITLQGYVGKDEAGNVLQELLENKNVNCQLIALNDTPTVTKLRVISRHQQLIRLDFEDGFDNNQDTELQKQFGASLKSVGAVVLSDYGKGTLRNIKSYISIAKQHNIPVLVDPKGNDFENYRGASLITPNLSEFEAVVGKCHNEDDIVKKAEKLIVDLELDALLVTRSEQGMSLIQKNKPVFHLPTRAQEVFDVTGAGDTVISILAAGIATGQTVEQAMALSNLGAGVVVSKLGTATVTVPELMQARHNIEGFARGVVTAQTLEDLLINAKQLGEKIVFTNGCFDILHPGHVSYLQQARQLGDRLIVAVNDDDSVKRLKGDDRPINNVQRRMSVLAALECIDWVIPFSEDTPVEVIKKIKPSIIVKGGDYTPEQVVGADIVKQYGGEVKILNFVEGHSTTDIINRILET
ncbi:ADP-heptose synthase / D-glycero-beta-D-manno-heptose 7-phosphate kinase [hydrothermal vent metagenome]|uniref:D-glycero-beta-D-manno-heptose 1-phosphate adenylyltransferase n=1 Tax=hydrothermal vent metagenome TaxID=652676 RepID=A0A3B1ACZ8_9ZZZZ